MAGYVLVGTLAAFGIFCGIWAAFGWLLPGGKGGWMVCRGGPGFLERSFIRRYVFLWEMGLVRCGLVVVDQGLSEPDIRWLQNTGGRIEICTLEELPSRLELERKQSV